MKKLIAYTYVVLMSVAATGCWMDRTDRMEDGNYEKKVTNVNSAGTKTTYTTKQNVDYDDEGNVDKTVTTKTTTDPKGLFNKSTTKHTESYEEDR